jgi:hemerythrin-like domain-containing protein
MSTETIAERRARVRVARLSERTLSLRDTITTLKYIGDVDQPEHEHGGHHAHTIRTARSALHHIERLRSRSDVQLIAVLTAWENGVKRWREEGPSYPAAFSELAHVMEDVQKQVATAEQEDKCLT